MMQVSRTVLRCVSRVNSSLPNGVLTSSFASRNNQISKTAALPLVLCKKLQNSASFCTTVTEKPKDDKPAERSAHFVSADKTHKLTDVVLSDYEKKKLVWTGFYKSVADVPDRVSDAKMHRAGDLWRIYTNVFTGVVVFITLMATIKQGQRYRKKQIEEKATQAREHVLHGADQARDRVLHGVAPKH